MLEWIRRLILGESECDKCGTGMGTRLIRLHDADTGEVVHVRVATIETYGRTANGKTYITMVSGNILLVKERDEVITLMIR